MGTVSDNAFSSGSGMFYGGASSSNGYHSVSNYTATKATNTAKKAKKAADDFVQTMDYVAIALERMAASVEQFKGMADLYQTYRNQNPELDLAITQTQEQLKFQRQAYDRYMAQADAIGLSDNYKTSIQNGALDISNITDENLYNQIQQYQEFYDKAQDVKNGIIDIGQELRELNLQKLENIADDFDRIISYKESLLDMQEALNDLNELKGIDVTEMDYSDMMAEQADIVGYYAGEVEQLQNQFDELVSSGVIVKNNDDWWEWKQTIQEAQNNMYEASSALLELRDSIFELRMKPVEDAIDTLDELSDTISDYSDLINDAAIFDDNGVITNAGLTQIGLLGQQLATSKQKVAELDNAIISLNKQLANGNITQNKYNELLKEYSSQQRQATADTKAAMDALVELRIEGINKEVDAYNKLIDVKIKDLQASKEYEDYKSELDEKQAAINAKQAEIAAIQNDETKKQQLRKLNSELEELQKSYDDTVQQHKYEAELQGYQDSQEMAQENAEQAINELQSNLAIQIEAIQNMLAASRDNYDEVYTYLNMLANVYGANLTSDLSNPWKTAQDAVQAYMDAVNQANAQVHVDTSQINVPTSSPTNTPAANEKEESSIIKDVVNSHPEQSPTPAPPQASNNSDIWRGIASVPSTKGLSWLNPEVSINDRIAWNGYATGYSNQKTLYSNLGGEAVHGAYSGSYAQNVWMIQQLKNRGFSTGGITELVKKSGEDGFFLGKKDEALISAKHVPLIQELLNNVGKMDSAISWLNDMKFSHPILPNNNPTITTGEIIVNIQGNVDQHVLPSLQEILQQAQDKTINAIRNEFKKPGYGGIHR